MADLISRAAAMEAFMGKPPEYYHTSYIVGELNCVPAVDAVPVEWLKKRRDIYMKAYHAGHESELRTAAILNDTLQAWQKEQEAR